MASSAKTRTHAAYVAAIFALLLTFSTITSADVESQLSNPPVHHMRSRRRILDFGGIPPAPFAPSPGAPNGPGVAPSPGSGAGLPPPPPPPTSQPAAVGPGSFSAAPSPGPAGSSTTSSSDIGPPPPPFVDNSPPPAGDIPTVSSSNKSTTGAAVGASVGIVIAFLVSLGAVVYFKPEWLSCCRGDMRREAQYERHMTDF